MSSILYVTIPLWDVSYVSKQFDWSLHLAFQELEECACAKKWEDLCCTIHP